MPRPQSPKLSPYWLYGSHPIAAALANPHRTCTQLLATTPALQTLKTLLQQYPPEPAQQRLAQATLVAKQTIDKLYKNHTTHQSLSLQCLPLLPPSLPELVESLRQQTTTTLVMLDRVQDPHNIGAILRSARFFNANALLLAKGHAPQENASIAKAACGALEHIPILHVNLAQTLATLGKQGWSRIAFDTQEAPPPKYNNATTNILNAPHKVLVFGAEGEGLRPLVKQRCDLTTRIAKGEDNKGNDDANDSESLNVSNAVAVALALMRHRRA